MHILNEVAKQHANGAKTVGITYSANQGQTDRILKTYASKKWNTGTDGANQARVMAEVEYLLTTPQYAHLQQVFRIVPITTMKKDSTGDVAADDSSVQQSLDNATQFMANGGTLLGWTNQTTPQGSLAIGGGIAAKVQTPAQMKMVDNWVQQNLTQPSTSKASKWAALQSRDEAQHQAPSKTTDPSLQVKVKSEKYKEFIRDYQKKFEKDEWYKDRSCSEVDGKLELSFKNKQDLTEFFCEQATKKRNFIVVDKATNTVMAYCQDGKLFHATGKEVKQGDSLTPSGKTLEQFKKPITPPITPEEPMSKFNDEPMEPEKSASPGMG